MDGSSVIWKFYEKVEKSQEEPELSKLVNIGNCTLHVVHGTLKTGLISCFLQHVNFTTLCIVCILVRWFAG